VKEVPSELAVITGASKGIGKATALALSHHDLELLITARNEYALKNIAKEIRSNNVPCSYYVAELGDINQIDKLVEQIKSKKKNLSLLVHCAGVAFVKPFHELTLAQWKQTLDINLTATFYLTQQCFPLLGMGSKIIFINSVGGKRTFSNWSAYCASKYGLRALADTMRQELQAKGIKVTSIYPASVDTTLHDKLPLSWDRTKMLPPEAVANIVVSCYLQSQDVLIKEIDLENISGTF
jgi:NADP-dependent 3-hydroxy acid dehydrogenase YdfG